jgi:hypothetical protein
MASKLVFTHSSAITALQDALSLVITMACFSHSSRNILRFKMILHVCSISARCPTCQTLSLLLKTITANRHQQPHPSHPKPRQRHLSAHRPIRLIFKTFINLKHHHQRSHLFLLQESPSKTPQALVPHQFAVSMNLKYIDKLGSAISRIIKKTINVVLKFK